MSVALSDIEPITDSEDEGRVEENRSEIEEEARFKRARMSKLHENYVAPLSFIAGAVESAGANNNFNITKVGMPFGHDKEAYARKCYEDITQEIHKKRKEFRSEKKAATLFVIAGTSGIGKSDTSTKTESVAIHPSREVTVK